MGKLFFGTYNRSLDEKARLQIPPSLLSKEGENTFYILKGFEGCIAVYPEEEFQTFLASLQARDWNDPEDRAYIRLASASVKEMKLDSHGRIALGKATLDDYGLSRDVTILGALDHFEIWDPTSYAKYLLKNSGKYETLAGRSHR